MTRILELPTDVFDAVIKLAGELKLEPSQTVAHLVKAERNRLERMRVWQELAVSVQHSNHPLEGKTVDEIVKQLRKTRQEIWDAEYAHLYR